MNKQLVDKLKQLLEGDSEESSKVILERVLAYTEDMQKPSTVDLIKDIVEEVVDNKLQGEQMKQKLEMLDCILDCVVGTYMEASCMMEDPHMQEMGNKACSMIVELRSYLEDCRKLMDPTSEYMVKEDGFYKQKMGGAPQSNESDLMLSEIKTLVGVDNSKLVSTIGAFKSSLECVKSLTEELNLTQVELDKVKSELALSEKTKLVDDSISGRVKKLLPKQRQWALSLSKEQLVSYLEVAPVLNLTERTVDAKVEADEVSLIQLSDLDKKLCQAMGVSEEAFKKQKMKNERK